MGRKQNLRKRAVLGSTKRRVIIAMAAHCIWFLD